tara:strand:- start:4934 stop:5725 length:792 start_codon:yes stop_codon:yes gene_type:complete
MSEDATILTTVEDGIARVVLHQPKRRNAMRYQMWVELGETMDRLAADPAVRVIVVAGAGAQAFCAGADISEFDEWRSSPEKARVYDAATHVSCEALKNIPKPTIGEIRGSCIGGGMELALLCDIRLCSDDARFGVTPAKLGLGYNLDDTCLLVERLGAPATREILFTGRIFSPDEALRLGIVNRVATGAGLTDMVNQYASDIAANAPLTLKASKAIIAEAAKVPDERNQVLCNQLVDDCYASADFIEGRRAFAEKRKPQFTGA